MLEGCYVHLKSVKNVFTITVLGYLHRQVWRSLRSLNEDRHFQRIVDVKKAHYRHWWNNILAGWCHLFATPVAVRYWPVGISTGLLTILYIIGTLFWSRRDWRSPQRSSCNILSGVAGFSKDLVAHLCTDSLFGSVGFCCRFPYRRSILELWTNYGLVAF